MGTQAIAVLGIPEASTYDTSLKHMFPFDLRTGDVAALYFAFQTCFGFSNFLGVFGKTVCFQPFYFFKLVWVSKVVFFCFWQQSNPHQMV